MFKKTIALFLSFETLISPVLAGAASTPGAYGKLNLPQVVAGTLPVVRLNPDGSQAALGASVSAAAGGTLTINQSASQAVINWNSFNVAAGATVRFNQGTGTPGTANWVPNSSYQALNRIYDLNPSQIFGSISADGKIYLINQNGFLFGAGSRVDTGALVASTLNLRDKDFQAGVLHFAAENYQSDGYQKLDSSMLADAYKSAVLANLALPMPSGYSQATVSNQGTISAGNGGSVFLMGPAVENYGTLNAPAGSVGLVAVQPGDRKGLDYDIQLNDTSTSTVYSAQGNVGFTDRNSGGAALNAETGEITADSGVAGMYGKTVIQNGLIRSITAVKKGGFIELLASDSVSTGPQSVTATPVSSSGDTLISSTPTKGTIVLAGLMGQSQSDYAPAATITHQGVIRSPSGNVYLEASNDITLGATSVTDVSGVWVDEQADAILIHPQLNTQNLRDYFGQKTGILLGQNVWVNALLGSTIGDISGYYGSAQLTAGEQSTQGGSILLGSHTLINSGVADGSTTQQIQILKGALVNFSGGGYRYAAGVIPTTQLLSGTTLYDISNAPEWLTYDRILTSTSYFAGAERGSDAGSLGLLSRQVAIGGTLAGFATRGSYQTLTGELTDKMGYQNTLGREEPAGGALTVGADNVIVLSNGTGSSGQDYLTNGIELVAGGKAPANPVAGDSVISADTVNGAGLSSLSLYANRSFTLDAGALLSLAAFGRKGAATSAETLNVAARSIDIGGEISAPAGIVNLIGADNVGSPVNSGERVVLETGSSISVAGERVDNSGIGAAAAIAKYAGLVTGGSLTITDNTAAANGIFQQAGAVLDVSGGYSIAASGSVTGGDAGSISLTGPSIQANGELRGYSLAGRTGGMLTLQTEEILVSNRSSATLAQGIVLSGDRFAGTGFTRLSLKSYNDLTVESGVDLAPSLVRLAQPVPGASPGSSAAPGSGYDLTTATPDLAGTTSISLAANSARDYLPVRSDTVLHQFNYASRLDVAQGATVETAPGGSLTLSGPTVQIDGTLTALAGSISVSAKTDPNDVNSYLKGSGTLLIGSTGRLNAGGYNKVVNGSIDGIPKGYTPLGGGSITLSAVYSSDPSQGVGDLVISPGALLDVSGAPKTTSVSQLPSGSIATATLAGDPGSISIAYQNSLTLAPGNLLASKALGTGQKGGTLTITSASTVLDSSVSGADLTGYQNSGFDDLTLRSYRSLLLSGDAQTGTIEVARHLTLDAPLLVGTGSGDVTISSPWITLTNSYYPGSTDISKTTAQGAATLNLVARGTGEGGSGGFLDVTGGVQLSGFSALNLTATQDLRLSDRYYPAANGSVPASLGLLETAGDLTLQAQRIYPTSQSVFTVQADSEHLVDAGGKALVDAGGNPVVIKHKITILPGDGTPSADIYSAYGSLKLVAGNGIDQKGYLAAPLGTLTLDGGGGRVTLYQGSTTSTAGAALVDVGSLDDSLNWTRTDNSVAAQSTPLPVSGEPSKSITITSANGEVVTQSGSTVNVSGGGGVFGYSFVPDLTGTVSPIAQKGTLNGASVRPDRFVILPDQSVTLPGSAVYLAADNRLGLKAGLYSLLPESYAFVPGALIISPAGTPMAPSDRLTSKEGYDIVAGYATVTGTGIQPASYTGYTVRSAADVLREGHFETRNIGAGDGGAVSFAAPAMLIGGTISASGLSGYQGGSLSLSAKNINILNSAAATDLVPGTLEIGASSFKDQGLETLNLGTLGATDTLTLAANVNLTVPEIALAAGSSITLQSGAQINASSASLATGGVLTDRGTIQAGSLSLTATSMDYSGALQLNQGTLTITGKGNIYLVGSASADTTNLYLTRSFTDNFSSIGSVTMVSASDIGFQDPANASLTGKGSLTLDAARIQAAPGVNVVLTAPSVNLVNSGKAGAASGAARGSATLSVDTQALGVDVGNGDDSSRHWGIALDGFGTLNLGGTGSSPAYRLGDLTLSGVGTLSAPADLNLNAARIVTGWYADAGTSQKTAHVTLDAGSGTVSIAAGSGTAGTAAVPGGFLEIKGGSILDASVIEIPSGQVQLVAGGGITLASGGQILARGSLSQTANPGQVVYAPGGAVTLSAGSGDLTLAAGSLVDVSAADRGDAGSVSLAVPGGVLSVQGRLAGTKGSGATDQGGSFALVAERIDGSDAGSDLSSLNTALNAGGFDREISLRALQGSLAVAPGDSLKAGKITLEADGEDSTVLWDGAGNRVTGNLSGNISVLGVLDASGASGGEITLLARNDLSLGTGSRLLANATGSGASGGLVYLKAGDAVTDALGGYHTYGSLTVNGALIDLSGSGTGSGGTVYFRAMRNDSNDDVLMSFDASAQVKGAAAVDLEGVKVYNAPASGNLADMDTSTGGVLFGDTAAFAGTTTLAAHFTTINDPDNGLVDINPSFSSTVLPGNFDKIGATRASLSGLVQLDGFRLLPGLEIRGSGSLSLSGSGWDLSAWRPAAPVDAFPTQTGPNSVVGAAGVAPGAITIRAGGDLAIGADLIDHSVSVNSYYQLLPGSTYNGGYQLNPGSGVDWMNPITNSPSMEAGDLRKENARPSWGFALVAGADLRAGDPMALNLGSAAQLSVGTAGGMVYTEDAPIRFASAGDASFGAASKRSFILDTLPATLGTFNGDITGTVRGNLFLNSGVIQSGTGSIDLTVKGDVNLSLLGGTGYGSIRSTGEPAAPGNGADLLSVAAEYWNYHEGGDISVLAGGSVWGWNGTAGDRAGAYDAHNAWDKVSFSSADNSYHWSANYDPDSATQGIAAMGGGDVTLWSGKDLASQVGAFGAGDLRIFAAGDAYGRFLVANGTGSLTVMGNIGAAPVFTASTFSPSYRQPTLEMMNDSTLSATAFGALNLGAVLDPMLSNNLSGWDPSFQSHAALTLTALGGGVSLLGEMFDRTVTGNLGDKQVLPQSVAIAASGDITFYANTYLAPSATGNLQLFSGGSIGGAYPTSAATPTAAWLTLQMLDNVDGTGGFYTTRLLGLGDGNSIYSHAPSADNPGEPLHWNDPNPVQIVAKGDVSGLRIISPKVTEISAGADFHDALVSMQNLHPGDVSSLLAGGSLTLSRSPNAQSTSVPDYSGVEQGGPGYLVVMAQNTIDLGNSQGLRSVGNSFNGLLDSQGASLIVVAGSSALPTGSVGAWADNFFQKLSLAGNEYSLLLAGGDKAGAATMINDTRTSLIDPFLAGFSGDGGSISMVQSQISTTSPGADIYLVAMKNIDVGRSALNQANAGASGIFTDKGGAIDILSVGDLNVNASRVMTFFGGDILVWSDQGNINAGRGSKTAISAQPPHKVPVVVAGQLVGYKLEFNPPSVGSGIRAVTYDPNTSPGEGLKTPDPGGIGLFAPKGVIDAGEAGIAGGKITLGATEVLNAKNISASAGSVGVPSTSDSGVSLGALSGAGSVTENSKMIEQASSLGGSKDKAVQQSAAVDDFMSKWLDLRIVSFDSDESGTDGDARKEKGKNGK